jgi:hypothetical protein
MLLCVLLAAGVLAPPAGAQVNVNVNIGAPPAVVVPVAPTMVFLSDPGVYVAVGVPYDIFFIGGRYYYIHGDNWFWAPGYGGPWNYVVYKTLPPGLRKHKMKRLREFREREYRVYKVQGRNFNGKYFDAEPGPGLKVKEQKEQNRDEHSRRGKKG